MKRNASQGCYSYIEMVGLYLQHLAVLLAHLSNSRVSPNPPFLIRITGNVSPLHHYTMDYPCENFPSRAVSTNRYFRKVAVFEHTLHLRYVHWDSDVLGVETG